MTEQPSTRKRPKILVLGATGLTGGAISALLDDNAGVEVVRAARQPGQVETWRSEGKAAVLIDLNDARTFPAALSGIDRLFVMSGYTIEMTHQVKTITDAASIVESARQIFDGRMAHIGAVTDTVFRLLGRPPVTLDQWARRNHEALSSTAV